jgi:dihydroflavonol-4-reductase
MTSSTQAASYPTSTVPEPWDESVWSDPTRSDMNAYGRSKVIAERAAWELVDREGARERLSVVLPGAVLGPVLGRDYSFSLTIVERLLKGAMPGLPRVGFSAVDIRDIADLHIRCLDDPAAGGERFIGTEGFYWFSDIAALLRRELGPDAAKVPTREIPSLFVRALGLVDKEVRSLRGDLGVRRAHSSAKAQDRLGWRPRPMAESLRDCGRSLKAEGVV